jgi:chromosome segregation ATPase
VQENALKDKIISYENSNNQMDADLTRTIEECGDLDNQISNAQNELSRLQGDIAEAAALAEKYKSEAVHYQKATQA